MSSTMIVPEIGIHDAVQEVALSQRIANVLRIYLECPIAVIVDRGRVTIEDAYAHVFSLNGGCDHCREELARMNRLLGV